MSDRFSELAVAAALLTAAGVLAPAVRPVEAAFPGTSGRITYVSDQGGDVLTGSDGANWLHGGKGRTPYAGARVRTESSIIPAPTNSTGRTATTRSTRRTG